MQRIILIFLTLLAFTATNLFADRDKDHRFLPVLENSSVDLASAVKRVEVQMKANVFKAKLKKKGHRQFLFNIQAVINDEIVVVLVDARSGQIINATEAGFWENWSNEDSKEVASQLKIPMSMAIQIAQKACEGKAIKAKIKLDDGQSIYEVDVISASGKCEAMIDGENGTVYIEQDHD